MLSETIEIMTAPKETTALPHPRFELFLRFVMALFAAHFIVINGTSYSIFTLLFDPGYYLEMAFSVVVALLLITYINYVSNKLDQKFGWGHRLLERIMLQVFFGIIIPAFFEFFLIAMYFYLLSDMNVLDTGFMNNEFRVVVIMIAFFNLYCIARYFYYKLRHTEVELDQYKKILPVPLLSKTLTGAQQDKDDGMLTPTAEIGDGNIPVAENTRREVFIVHTTTRSIPIMMKDICCFYRANGCYYLRTEHQSVGDAYIIPQILKEVEALIDPVLFFRINRKMIVSFKSCISYRQGKGKTVELVINPPYADPEDKMKELPFVTVSEDRVQAFKSWMNR